jgi:hypothetical protein
MSLTQNLQRGSKGKDVKKVQNFLGLVWDSSSTIYTENVTIEASNGTFGMDTEAAVREYQSENGLNVDGIVGPQTWASMGFDDIDLTTLTPKLISVNTKSSSDRLELKKPIVYTPVTLKKPKKTDFISFLTNNQNKAMEKIKIKLQSGIELLKVRALDEISFKLEGLVPITLPFLIRPILEAALNKVEDDREDNRDLLDQFKDKDGNLVKVKTISTLNYIQNLPPEELSKLSILTPQQKQLTLQQLELLEENLSLLINTKNTLYSGLVQLTSTISSLENITQITDKIISVASTGVTTAKIGALAIPTAPFPITAGVITGISDTIKLLGDLIKENEGKLKPINYVVEKNKEDLIPIVEQFSTIDPFVGLSISFISFIKLLLKYPNLTQQDVDLANQETTTKLQTSLSQTPGPAFSVSNNETNAIADKILKDQLDPNSPQPFFYKGFKLTIEFDPNNTFSIPARRIKGENFQKVKLYSVPPDTGTGELNTSSKYSFTTSTQVLLEEVKFNIDQYLTAYSESVQNKFTVQLDNTPDLQSFLNAPVTQTPTTSTSGTNGSSGRSENSGLNPFGTEGSINGQVRFRGGQAWRWLGGNQNRWIKHTVSTVPFNRKGVYNGEVKIQEDNLYANKYKWSEVLYKWEFQSREALRKF